MKYFLRWNLALQLFLNENSYVRSILTFFHIFCVFSLTYKSQTYCHYEYRLYVAWRTSSKEFYWAKKFGQFVQYFKNLLLDLYKIFNINFNLEKERQKSRSRQNYGESSVPKTCTISVTTANRKTFIHV